LDGAWLGLLILLLFLMVVSAVKDIFGGGGIYPASFTILVASDNIPFDNTGYLTQLGARLDNTKLFRTNTYYDFSYRYISFYILTTHSLFLISLTSNTPSPSYTH
jgi:hypothetical protein